MKSTIVWSFAVTLVALAAQGCAHGREQNPRTNWRISPAPGGADGFLPPRREVYDGTEAAKDNGTQRNGPPTGKVFIGQEQTGGGVGSPESVASTDFNCSTGGDGPCTVELTCGAGFNTFDYESREFLVFTLTALDQAGNPWGQPVTAERSGASGGTKFTLTLPTCGMVRLTISVRETEIGPKNARGIQTKFSVNISSYGCD